MEHNSQLSSKIYKTVAFVVIIWIIILKAFLPLKYILVLNTILDWITPNSDGDTSWANQEMIPGHRSEECETRKKDNLVCDIEPVTVMGKWGSLLLGLHGKTM